MTRSKKIGLLIPDLQSGGAERVLSLTSSILANAGFDVYLILYDSDNISYDFSGTLINLKSKAGTSIFSKVFKRISRIIKLSYYKYKYDFDTVISFLYSANAVNYYSIGRAKKVISCRGYSDYIKNGKKYARMINKIDSFIVQTEKMKSNFVNNFNVDESKITVLYNPVNIKEIKEKSKEKIEEDIQNFINNHKTICTVGSFKKDKGYWHLIKAFIKVKQNIEDAGLIFIGHRGEMEKAIKDMAKASGFKDDILFLGYQENPFKYVAKCDLYVCTSIYEGFPNALVEAMACGIPVLSTDCRTGPKEILSKTNNREKITELTFAEYGILVPELNGDINLELGNIDNNELIIARGIIKILSNKEIAEKYKKLSKVRVNDFNIDGYFNELVKII